MLIDTEAQSQLQLELYADEKLLWASRAKTGTIFRNSDIFAIPFSLLWLGVTINMIYECWTNGNLVIYLATISACIFAPYITVGRFFWDSKARGKTIYGITENRILIKSDFFFERIRNRSYKLA